VAARQPCITLIAHDGKKANLTDFATSYWGWLERCRLVATRSTGKLLQQ
jgi:methylglyoxal synthase